MPLKTKEEQTEYQRQWMNQRRQDWIDSQGGCCVECGSADQLEVDHIDPALKTMKPSSLWSRRQEIRDAELANCQVLCYDCHLEKTVTKGDGCKKSLIVPIEIVNQIRLEYIAGNITQKELAVKYNLHKDTIYRYLNHKMRKYNW